MPRGGFSLFKNKKPAITKKNSINDENYIKIMHGNKVNTKRDNLMKKYIKWNSGSKEFISSNPNISFSKLFNVKFMTKDFNDELSPENTKELIKLINKHNLEKPTLTYKKVGEPNSFIHTPNLKTRRNMLSAQLTNALNKATMKELHNVAINFNKHTTFKNRMRKMGVATRRLSVNSNNNPHANYNRRDSRNTIASNPANLVPNWN